MRAPKRVEGPGYSPGTPTSFTAAAFAEAGAVQPVARLVGGGHQGLRKAAVGKDGAVRRAGHAGAPAGEIALVLRGRAPAVGHGACNTTVVAAGGEAKRLRRVFGRGWERTEISR